MARFCIIQGCPVLNDIGPYIEIVTQDGHATIDSIYRGDKARTLLNKYGHHSQYQLAHATAAERKAWGILGTPDAPGHSTHELFSDGVAYREIPNGKPLQWWMQGFDVNAADAPSVMRAAQDHGWILFRPYPTGVELHHLNFKFKPRPSMKSIARIYRLRHTLPRS